MLSEVHRFNTVSIKLKIAIFKLLKKPYSVYFNTLRPARLFYGLNLPGKRLGFCR